MKKLIYILFAMVNHPLLAQLPNDTTVTMQGSLNEVVITAEKRRQLENEIPASVSVVSNQTISNEKVQTLRDITGIVPNLFMPEYGSRLTAPLYIRGIGARINNPSVGLYVDGVPYFEKSAFAFNLDNINRIEILRGPQGTLYGRNTMGGIVNVITRAPDYSRHTNLDVDLGNYTLQQYRLNHNQPIINQKLAIDINAGYMDHGGYYTNQFFNQSVGTDNSKDASVRLRFQPSSSVTLDYKTGGERSNERAYPYGIIDNQNKVNINYNHKSSYKRDLLDNSLSVSWNTGNFVIASVTSAQYLKDNQDADYDYSAADMYNSIQGSKENLYTQEFTFNTRLGDLNITGGLFGFTQHTNRDYQFRYGKDIVYVPANQRAFPFEYNQGNVEKNSSAAVYGELSYNLRLLEITAGLRYDYEENKTSYRITSFTNGNPTPMPESNYSTNLNKVLPKVSVRFKTTPTTSIYGTFTTGYKIGGFNLAAINEKDRAYGPENSYNYEAGFKGIIIPELLSANLSAFYIFWNDQQVANRIPTGYVYRNAGKSTSKGIESEISVQPFKKLVLGGAFGLTVAKYKEFHDTIQGVAVSYNNKYLPMVPRFTYSVYGNYSLNLHSASLRSVDFHASVLGIGTHYWDDANTHSQLPYSLTNANISLQSRWGRLTVWGKNIFDTKYRAYSFTTPGAPMWWAQPGLPSTYGITLAVNL